MKPKIILSIETSCDETAAAILEKQNDSIRILSNVVASSASLQEKFGGIIPEQAARQQLKSIIPVIKEALSDARLATSDIDAIALTQGPGLIGSLLVGVETAKVLSLIWNKPLIPINHLIGHFYANWIARGGSEEGSRASTAGGLLTPEDALGTLRRQDPSHLPQFPCIGLLVSGGHTDLVLFEDHGKYKYLGGTRDDAAGECFDKCARLLGLPYPGGPQISKLASSGNAKSFDLPRPMINSKDFDFSYSGLKTAVSNLIVAKGGGKRGAPETARSELVRSGDIFRAASRQDPEKLSNLCASIEQAIIDPLIKKTLKAAKKYDVKCIILGGGVAANKKLKEAFQLTITNEQLPIKLFFPPQFLCTDNAAMIASAAFFEPKRVNPQDLQANPNLSLAY